MLDLFHAIEKEDIDRVEELLANGADPNTEEIIIPPDSETGEPETTGFTPLMAAVAWRRDAIAERLLQYGANIHALDKHGACALSIAAGDCKPGEEHGETVKLLLAYGADPNFCGESRYTPLFAAALFVQRKKAVLLLEAGAKPSLTDAVRLGNIGLVQRLIEDGAAINIMDSDHRTPISHAIGFSFAGYFDKQPDEKARYQAILDLLLHAGATLSLADTIIMGDLERTRALLDAGHEIESRFGDDFRALHYAARFGHLEIVRLLMERGANVSAENCDGHTPLIEAEHRSHLEIAKLLRNAGAKR